MINPDTPFIFGTGFFEQHQKILLWFINTWLGKRFFCINGDKSSLGKNKILKIEPNAITWKGKKKKEYVAEFRTHNKFSKRLLHGLYPIWWLIHQWDTLFANNFQPEWNLGFDTLTVYPDADPESTSVDGLVDDNTGSLVWATVHDATAGTRSRPSQTVDWCMYADLITLTYYIGRFFALFDTSSIGATSTVNSAVYSVKARSDADGGPLVSDVNTTSVILVQTTPASNTDLVIGDYDQMGTTSGGSIALSAVVQNAYNDITLLDNTWISKTSITKLGTRNSRDVDNSAPTGSNEYLIYCADATGTTSDPKLVVTYTVAGAAINVSYRSLLGVGI